MKAHLFFIVSFSLLITGCLAQYKTGIKTSQAARNQLLQLNETQRAEVNYVDQYGNTVFKPADVYMGGDYNRHFEESRDYVIHKPQPSPESRDYIVQTPPMRLQTDTYRGSEYIRGFEESRDYVTPAPRPRILDPIAEFINKTRSQMSTGICYKEVPTTTLVNGATIVGNGTTPNMSRIQICCAGYLRNPHIYMRCEPVCKNDCLNGICTAPNTCVCLPGYLADHEGNCKSTCPIGCANGVCAENGECHCIPGYKLEPIHKKFCVPNCAHECTHGRCIAPNTCACEAGYRQDADNKCTPICEQCENGQCTAPGICQCHEGYQKTTRGCEPVCRAGCDGGRCVRPDVCECDYGFALDVSASKCQPVCLRSCVNGVCTGVDTCTCNPGYARDELDWSVCNPVCSQGCPQGYCSAPNLCRCNPGLVKSGIKGRTLCLPPK